MKHTWIITALALAGAAQLPLAAQQPAPAPRARAPRPEGRNYTFSFSGSRGRIGVLVNTVADSAADRYGARIDGVTPGGPADKAGLKSGDIITKFNGKALAGAGSEDLDSDESAPGHRLIELAHDLDPGDTVKIEYRRGTETKSATLVADEGRGFAFDGMGPMMRGEMEMPKMPFVMGDGMGDEHMNMNMGVFCMGDAWCELDLVTLNPDLGDYFGTKDGVLVVKAPADSGLPLKGGDVILSIGGRKPTSPSHAMRILRSYDAGETVSIEIMRHQKRSTISWTVPDENRRWRVRAAPRERGEQSMWIMPDRTEELRAAERALLDASGDQLRGLRQSQELLQNRLRTLRDNLRRGQIQTRELRRATRTVVI
ncbi:MAG TPA: PDZ domain-containing protein [Gemmatimonadales bacterium]|nr:PDZ domain-containing protein [Gemmatimonadales bacterium]